MTKRNAINQAHTLGQTAWDKNRSCVPYQNSKLKEMASAHGIDIWKLYKAYANGWYDRQDEKMNSYLQEIKNTKLTFATVKH